MKFKSDIEVQAGLKDSSGSIGTSGQILSSTGSNVSWINQSTAANDVQNLVKAGVAINKGQAVYVTGADGTNIIVGLASNASEATSSKTLGLLNATVAINGMADVVQIGRLSGLNTLGATAGDPVWLGTGGNLIYGLINKPYAPANLVFIGIVTRVNVNNGEIFVNVQNGFELNEIHDVDLKTNVPINGDVLGFNGTLWVNKTIAGWLGYTPANASGTTNYVSKFTGTTTLGNSLLFDNGTNVGIGTSTPGAKLDVSSGNINLSNSYNLTARNNANTFNISLIGRSSTDRVIIDADGYGTNIGGGGTVLINPSGGNVGIGTTSPSAKLEVSGIGYASSDFRAPIFYDSNNTAYYTDPASTSNLASTYIAGHYYGSGNSSNILIKTAANSSEMGIVGQNSSGAFKFQLYGNGGEYGFLNGEWASWDLRKVTNSNLYLNNQSTYYYGTDTAYLLRVYGTTDMRSPIYYDLDNTAYYVNPNGTSSLSLVIADNTIKSRKAQADGDYTTAAIWTESYSTTTTGVAFHISGTVGKFLEMRTNGILYWDNAPVVTTSTISVSFNSLTDKTGGTGTYQTSGDFRAPIFYDSNNTSYYVDPASTSNLYDLQITGASNKYLYINPGNGYEAMVRYNGGSGSSWYVGKRITTDLVGTEAFHFYSEAAGITVAGADTGGNFFASQSFRAGVFYDRDDTSYYLNPNYTSNLLGLTVTNTISGSVSGTAGSLLSYQSNWASTPTPTNVVGLLGWKNYGNGHVIFDASNSTTPGGTACSNTNPQNNWTGTFPTLMGWNGTNTYGVRVDSARIADSATSAGSVDFNNLTNKSSGTGTYQTSGDFRSPIFYDSDNTGYYVNPASTSSLNVLAVSRAYAGYDSGNADSFSCSNWFRSSGASGWYNQTYTGGWYMVDSTYVRSYNDKDVYTGGIMLSGSSHRAPIFYDSNNTYYYLDPNGTSNISSIVTRASITNSGEHGNSYIQNELPAANNGGSTGIVTLRAWCSEPNVTWDGAGFGYNVYNDGAGAYGFSRPNTSFGQAYMRMISNGTWYFLTANTSGTRYTNMELNPNGNVYFGNIAQAQGSLRAPIFYDTANTAYYLYPSGTSKLNTAEATGYVYASNYVQSATAMYSPVYYDGDDSSYYFDGSNTGDSIRVAGDVVAYYSDERLKDKKGNIENALEKVLSLNGFYYEPNKIAQELGYKKKLEVGVSAQEVEAVLPEIIKSAPIGGDYKTLDYGRLTPLLIEAIKEQQKQIEELKELVTKLTTK